MGLCAIALVRGLEYRRHDIRGANEAPALHPKGFPNLFGLSAPMPDPAGIAVCLRVDEPKSSPPLEQNKISSNGNEAPAAVGSGVVNN